MVSQACMEMVWSDQLWDGKGKLGLYGDGTVEGSIVDIVIVGLIRGSLAMPCNAMQCTTYARIMQPLKFFSFF